MGDTLLGIGHTTPRHRAMTVLDSDPSPSSLVAESLTSLALSADLLGGVPLLLILPRVLPVLTSVGVASNTGGGLRSQNFKALVTLPSQVLEHSCRARSALLRSKVAR